MSVAAVARRYAEALADVALEKNSVEATDREVAAFVEMMQANRELHDVFASPVVPQADKRKVLDAILARSKPSRTTANLLRTLLDHYRLHHLNAVLEQFRREINERRGMIVADVTTAAAVDGAAQQALAGRLAGLTGKQVQLRFHVDPQLIGGAVTRIGSVIYDGSVRTRLQAMRERLKQGGA